MRLIGFIDTAILIAFVAAIALHAQAQGRPGRRATRAAAADHRRTHGRIPQARRFLSAVLGRRGGTLYLEIPRSIRTCCT